MRSVSRWGAAAAAMLTIVLGVTSTIGTAASAAPVSTTKPGTQTSRSVPVKPVTGHYRTPAAMPTAHPASPVWPAGKADVALSASRDKAAPLPVWFGRPHGGPIPSGTAHVTASSRSAATAAGVDGMLLSVRPTAGGETRIDVSYAGFADAYGGDWASRLHLVALPSCALTTPAVSACRTQSPLATVNDTDEKTLSADLTLTAAGTAVVAATSSAAGGGGDFAATSLKPSGTWQSGGVGDGFTWSYPIAVPPVPGNLEPKIALTYNSQSQDGLTSSTNNQASWIGDGWDYAPGFIERSYASCHENPAGKTQTWDNCWSDKNQITLSLGGSDTALVRDDATGTWHAATDHNEKIDYLTGADNGAQNGEYWRVTTPDGTQYYFGKQKLPGWATGNATTGSVWTEPVFETDSTRPCYKSTFADSYCQQAYRWNLDYVVDVHQDAISYFYQPETNYYARDLGSTANTPYTRGGYLRKIQYGQRAGQVYSASPAGLVTFDVAGRCDNNASGCDLTSLNSSTSSHWPDVPYDANCAQNAACTAQSPAFWTSAMLTGIHTSALVGTAQAPVDSWSLSHSFPATGDSTTASLWLDKITQTGLDTNGTGPSGNNVLPSVVFTGRPLSNRVNVTDGYPPITRHRLDTITTETGEVISIDYSTAVTEPPSDPAANTTLAYPNYWTPLGQNKPILDWFNKYIVTHVTEQDPTGGSANDDIVTTYTPVGAPAWHYNENALTPADRRTWDQWRGYTGMEVSTGTAPDPATKTTYTYFRGMDGDHGASSSVTTADSRGEKTEDLDQYAGLTYETRVNNGSTVVTDTITDPWTSAATATQSNSDRHAYHVGAATTRVYEPLASGSTREIKVDSTHDPYGRVTATSDLGDFSGASDDLCTTTTYNDNTTAWIVDKPSEVKKTAGACGSSTPTSVLSDELDFYDGASAGTSAPTVGDPTTTKRLRSGATDYVTTTAVYDQYGRATSSTDGAKNPTSIAFTPAAGASPTSVAVTDALKMVTTTTYDSARGLPLTTTTPAKLVTSEQYDELGRLTAVYEPGRAAPSSPNIRYAYTVSNSGPSIVDTYTLNHDGSGSVRSETLYDSMLRARETQAQTPGSGRIITDTIYNSDGWQSEVNQPYYNGSAITKTIDAAQPGQVDSATGYLYDQAGRKTAEISYALGSETWRTTYAYGGNFVTTQPPAGATPSTTVNDARGHTVTLRQYHTGVTPDYLHAPTGGYDDTTYSYTPDGHQATERDPGNNTWSWTYDLLGQQIKANDPDTGITTTTYDGDGKPLTVTDADGRQLTNAYDADGRKTGLYDTTGGAAATTADELSGWTYDTVKAGLPASSTSYSGGDTYTDAVVAYNLYGKAAGHRYTLTGKDAGLLPTGGYVVSAGFEQNGLASSEGEPAIGGLPTETVTLGFDAVDLPTSLGGTNAYVTAIGYSGLKQPLQYTLAAGATTGYETLTYDHQTQAVATTAVDGFGHTSEIDHVAYNYGGGAISKGTGLLASVVDTQDGGAQTDTQCYAYDYATRLQLAWTATDNCAVTPTSGNSGNVGGNVAPYWQSWTYDASGDRSSETDHGLAGAADTTTTYEYETSGHGHALSDTTATGPTAAANTATYSYDGNGNTTDIKGGALGDQKLTWTSEGKVGTDTTAAGTTTDVYDADGILVVQRDPDTTTLFLGDQQIVMDNSSKALTGTRYYKLGDTVIATRKSGGQVNYVFANQQNTAELSVDAASGTETRRAYLPFGGARGLTPTGWPGNQGFVGGHDDANTGMEQLGARTYDATIGRFLSADPLLESADPSQTGGYAYAGNDPATRADPSGLRDDPMGKVTDVAAVGNKEAAEEIGQRLTRDYNREDAQNQRRKIEATAKKMGAAQFLSEMNGALYQKQKEQQYLKWQNQEQAEYLAEANDLRDEIISYLQDLRANGVLTKTQMNKVVSVTAAWNQKTGKVYVGWRLDNDPVGFCAEDDCDAQNMADGGERADLNFVKTYRPRDLAYLKVCVSCQLDYDQSQFETSGADGAPGGAWDIASAQTAADEEAAQMELMGQEMSVEGQVLGDAGAASDEDE
jgi:RHS repeat-associated protein